jgi:hypothetical protein
MVILACSVLVNFSVNNAVSHNLILRYAKISHFIKAFADVHRNDCMVLNEYEIHEVHEEHRLEHDDVCEGLWELNLQFDEAKYCDSAFTNFNQNGFVHAQFAMDNGDVMHMTGVVDID